MRKYIFRLVLFCLVSIALNSCKPTATVYSVETNVIKMDTLTILKDDSASLAMIYPYKQKMQNEMDAILGYTETALVKGYPEGLLNNFIADLILLKANEYYHAEDGSKVDFCLLNSGGLRASLPEGPVTKSNVFELMPFNNELVVLKLTGEKVQRLFSYVAKKGGMPESGFVMGIKDTTATNISIGGKAFDINKTYNIATSDYLANGGDKMFFFKYPVNTSVLGVKIRDAIIEFMITENNNNRTLKSKLDKRIYFEK